MLRSPPPTRPFEPMRIQCPHCPAMYELDDGRVPPAGLSIKCPKCKSAFTVHRKDGAAETASRPAVAKVPLPGTPKAGVPARRQKAAGGSSAVPLPGTPQAQAKRAASASSAAVVPLPGTQPKQKPVPAAAPAPRAPVAAPAKKPVAPPAAFAPEDAPTEQIDDAIPLPGLDM